MSDTRLFCFQGSETRKCWVQEKQFVPLYDRDEQSKTKEGRNQFEKR